MKVEKKNGMVEEFQAAKIATSLANASDDASEPLNESDIYLVMNSVVSDLSKTERESVNTEEIYSAIYNDLQDLGFKNVAESYKYGTGRE